MHLGIVLIAVAVIGNEFFQQNTNVTLANGESVTLGRYEIAYTGLEPNQKSNLTEYGARLMVFDIESGKTLGTVIPKRNIYDKTPDQPTSEVGLHMSLIEDVYVVLNGWEAGGSTATFTIYVNPLTIWMWIGGLVLVLGTLIASWPHPGRRRSEAVSSVAYAAGSTGD